MFQQFSVVVPTYNRPGQLQHCLGSLARLAYPPECFEVIVVDDGGSVPLHAVIEKFNKSLNLRLLRRTNGGPGAARNTGAEEAKGQYLAFTDDDCRVDSAWLEDLAGHFHESGDQLIGGRIVNGLPDNSCSTMSQIILDAAYLFYNRRPERSKFFASMNLAAPRAGFLAMGGFDQRFRIASEDRDFCDRWRHSGGTLFFAPNATVAHFHALTLSQYVRQYFNYGRGARLYHASRRFRGGGRLRDDVGFYGQMPKLFLAPIRQLPWRHRLASVLLLLLWQAANLTGFGYDAVFGRKRGRGSVSIEENA